MKTVLEQLETLQEPYRTQALDNTKENHKTLYLEVLDLQRDTFKEALHVAFVWGGTPEGFDYWYTVYKHESRYTTPPPSAHPPRTVKTKA